MSEGGNWREQLHRIARELEAKGRQRIAISADLMATEQQLDEMEREAEALPEPGRAQQMAHVQQLRSNHNLTVGLNQLGDEIDHVMAAVLVLAERVAQLERGEGKG